MTYKEAMSFMEDRRKYGSVLGLDVIRHLLQRLNNPQDRICCIHIAGTNGKGSTAAFLAEILKEAGYKTGKYTSPSVFSYEEKYQINGKKIDKDYLCRIMDVIKEQVTHMDKEENRHPTSFEMETAMSFYYFYQEKCDFVILETGLGGRDDATNIIKAPAVSVLTSISMDHGQILGHTLKEIAGKKAGIIKEGVPVVSVKQKREAEEVILKMCEKQNAILKIADRNQAYDVSHSLTVQTFSYEGRRDLKIEMAGAYQIENAILAIETCGLLQNKGMHIPDKAIRKGLKRAKWPGRFSVIHYDPLFIIDGAHNPDGAGELKKSIETYFQNKRILFIMGVFSDKNYDEMAKATAPLADHVITLTPPDKNRALPAITLANAVLRYNKNVTAADSIEDALDMALLLADKEEVIIAFGSLSYLEQIQSALKKKKRSDGNDRQK